MPQNTPITTAELAAELAAAQQQLEFDRTTCYKFVKAIDAALDGRFWLTEGRGSYAWDDDRYRTEFHDAAVKLRSIVEPMRKMAQNLSSRLPTTEAIMKARVDLESRAEAAEAKAAAFRTAAEEVIARWDSPAWKDLPHTGVVINALRAALGAAREEGK